MNKKCPFCKKEIELNTIKCPFCTGTLIEKFEQVEQVKFKYVSPNKDNTDLFNKTRKSLNDKQTIIIKWFKYNKIRTIVIILLCLFVILIFTDKRVEPVEIPNVPIVSLNNGTLLKSNPIYLDGFGTLEIKNGTGQDAIAKLINYNIDRSIYTVYIKANSVYTIKDISDGKYKLMFSLGRNWDQIGNQFLQDKSYEAFEESFNFTTDVYNENGYQITDYTVFEVSLNPVINGDAKTTTVNPVEFSNY